jgi:hypothetical protein
MFLPFLKNPFASKNLAREDFRELLGGHLDRLNSDAHQGRYADQYAALLPHYTAYAAFLGTQAENLGERLGNTDAVERVLADFKAFAKKELLIDVNYVFQRQKPNPAALTAFLPKGRSEYSTATLLTLPTLLERTARLTQKFKPALGTALADKAEVLEQAYKDARNAQGESKGEVQDDTQEEEKLRKAAARQMKLNLLEQVKMHIDEPEAVKALYDPKWFGRNKGPKK